MPGLLCQQIREWRKAVRASKAFEMKRHSGEKPNKCNQCNYASFHARNLRTHVGATVNRWQQSIFMEQRGLLCQQIGVEKSSQRASKYLKWKDKVENSQTNATMYLYGATRPTMSTIPRVEKSFHSFQTKHQHFQNIHKNKDKKSNIFKCPNIWGIVLPTSTILIIVNISTTTWESKLKA